MGAESRREVLNKLIGIMPMLRNQLWKPMEAKCRGISKSQGVAIQILLHFGAMNMTRLSESMYVSNQQMTRIIDGLVEKGFVERFNDPKNRRIVMIRITSEGIQFTKQLQEKALDLMVESFRKISDDEILVLNDAVGQIERIIMKI